MSTLLSRPVLFAFSLALAACSQGRSTPTTLDGHEPGPNGASASSSSGGSGAAEGNGSSSGGATSSGSAGGGGSSSSGGGATAGGGDGGGPPPSLPPQPGGFQSTIAPLLDQSGCTECHHHGRPVDLTTYPFEERRDDRRGPEARDVSHDVDAPGPSHGGATDGRRSGQRLGRGRHEAVNQKAPARLSSSTPPAT
jgi:hypothetical protein